MGKNNRNPDLVCEKKLYLLLLPHLLLDCRRFQSLQFQLYFVSKLDTLDCYQGYD